MTDVARSVFIDEYDPLYPSSDGKPMAEDTEQFDRIVLVKEGLEYEYKNNPDVFVAGDLLWYPVKGRPEINLAPDAMVAFGRPKGARRSYRQWSEGNIAPQVVFEIWSYSNTKREKLNKRNLYEQYGVEEFYTFDNISKKLEGWVRRDGRFEQIEQMQNWVSPRLGIRFEVINDELYLYHPDGQPFRSLTQAELRAEQLEREAQLERQRAERERQRAERAEQRAQRERQRAEKAEQESAAFKVLLSKLRERGIDPDTL